MSASMQKRGRDDKPIQCFLRVSIGGEVLAKDIVVELDMENYPKTCKSFLSLCEESRNIVKHNKSQCATDSSIRTSRKSPQSTYRGCEFHRVVPGLCVQAGDWERFDGTGGFSPLYGRNWKDEGDPKKYKKHDTEGIVSMANAGKPNTNGSQFFVTLKSTPHLDGKHTVFGRVVSGIESVRKMADVERGEKDRPVSLQRIVIEDCGRLEKKHNTEEESSNESRSKEHKRKKKSRKSERKKRKKKRHRSHRYESSSSESYSSDDSESSDDCSEKHRRRSRERRSRKHRERKRRRKTYDSSESDESSDSSDDGNSNRDQKHRRQRSSRDERRKRGRKKRDREKRRRKEKN